MYPVSQATRGSETASHRRVSRDGACDHPPTPTPPVAGAAGAVSDTVFVVAADLRDRGLLLLFVVAGVGVSYGGGDSESAPASGVNEMAAEAERVETIVVSGGLLCK